MEQKLNDKYLFLDFDILKNNLNLHRQNSNWGISSVG